MEPVLFLDPTPRPSEADATAAYPQHIQVGTDEHGDAIVVRPTTTPRRFYVAGDDEHAATAALVRDVNQCLAQGYDVYFVGAKNTLGNDQLHAIAGVVDATTDPAAFSRVVSRVHAVLRERQIRPTSEFRNERPVVLAVDNIGVLRRVVDESGVGGWDELDALLYDIASMGRACRVHVVFAGRDVPIDALDPDTLILFDRFDAA